MPKEAVYQATLMQGGEIEAKGMSGLPRNRQQIANYRRVEKKRDDSVLYSVMLECKLAQGTQEAFVRDVKAAPDPQCVLFFDWQIADMERFVTGNSEQRGILTIDPTYNLGQFYVTPTTYPHLMLEDITIHERNLPYLVLCLSTRGWTSPLSIILAAPWLVSVRSFEI